MSLIVALGFAVSKAEPASASNVAVSPVNINLAREGASALLTLTNQGTQNITYSLSAYTWSQGESGKIDLGQTSDIIFFPTLLTIAPGESRNVRIGTQLHPEIIERTYRLLLDELPPAHTGQPAHGLQVQVLTRLSIPIFLAPTATNMRVDASDLEARGGALTFVLHNTGSVHVVPTVTAVAHDTSGAKVYTLGPQQLWYVLAGGARNVRIPLPSKMCATVRDLTISIEMDSLAVKKSVATPSGACAS